MMVARTCANKRLENGAEHRRRRSTVDIPKALAAVEASLFQFVAGKPDLGATTKTSSGIQCTGGDQNSHQRIGFSGYPYVYREQPATKCLLTGSRKNGLLQG